MNDLFVEIQEKNVNFIVIPFKTVLANQSDNSLKIYLKMLSDYIVPFNYKESAFEYIEKELSKMNMLGIVVEVN